MPVWHLIGALRPVWLSSDGNTLLLVRGPSDFSLARELLLISAGKKVASYPLPEASRSEAWTPVRITTGIGVFDGAAFAMRGAEGSWHYFELSNGGALGTDDIGRLSQRADWRVWQHCLEHSDFETQVSRLDLPKWPEPVPSSETLMRILKSESDDWTRQCALRISAAGADAEALGAAMLVTVDDNDERVRGVTAGLLKDVSAETARQIVAKLRSDPRAWIRYQVEQIAWDVAREDAVKLTLEGIRNGDPKAFGMAGFKRVREARPLLIEAAEAGGERERDAFRALHGIMQKGDFESLATLVASARDAGAILWGLLALRRLDEWTRQHRLRDRGIGCNAVSRLAKALDAGDRAEAKSASRALELVRCSAATVALVDSLRPGRGDERARKERLVALLRRGEDGAAAALRALLSQDDTPEASRRRIRRWLDRVGERQRTQRCTASEADPFALVCPAAPK